MMKNILLASLLFAVAGSGKAMADDDCHVAMDKWQPREAVQKMAEARGWQVSRIKIDDGCYEIRGLDETGRAIKVEVDPGTLAIIEMKRKDRHDDGRTRGLQEPIGTGPIEGSGPVRSNKLFETGGSPKTVVK